MFILLPPFSFCILTIWLFSLFSIIVFWQRSIMLIFLRNMLFSCVIFLCLWLMLFRISLILSLICIYSLFWGQLDIVLFCLLIKVHSSYLFTFLCSQEVRSTCLTWATKVPLLPEVKRVPREIEAKYLFPCLPSFQASDW